MNNQWVKSCDSVKFDYFYMPGCSDKCEISPNLNSQTSTNLSFDLTDHVTK